MKVENAKIEGLGEMNHSTAMVLRNKKVKRLILKQFQYGIDFLMHIPGLNTIRKDRVVGKQYMDIHVLYIP